MRTRITDDCDGKSFLHDRSSIRPLSLLQFLCLQMCVYGGGGGPSLGNRPPGSGGGLSSLGWGTTRGRGTNFLRIWQIRTNLADSYVQMSRVLPANFTKIPRFV